MSRTETKFFLDFVQYSYLRSQVQQLFRRDHHSGSRGVYPVLSAYFDTPNLESFYQKVDGNYLHSKFRLRRYGHELSSSGLCFLEAKLKFDQNQRKIRIKLPYDRSLLNPTNWYNMDRPEFDDLLQWLPVEGLVHSCSVYYEREPFEGIVGGQHVRINFDTNLKFLAPDQTRVFPQDPESQRLLVDESIILEVKTDFIEIPEAVQSLLRSVGIEQTRVSKYAEAIMRIDEQCAQQGVVV